MKRSCFLQSVDGAHEPIELPDGVEVVIGRSAQTKIKDTRCSRRQLSLTADLKNCNVLVKQLGENASALSGGVLIAKGESRVLEHNRTLEVLEGLSAHRVCFEPPPSKQESPLPKKAKLEMKNMFQLGKGGGKGGSWESVEGGKMLVFTPEGISHSEKVAAYDLDWTLVGTKSNRVHPKDKDDWCLLLPEIPGKLKELHSEGYKLTIFSNQAGIGMGRVLVSDFKMKIESVIRKLGVPMQAFIATGSNRFRKPMTGMWQHLSESGNGGISISTSDSLYCGDAAGRPLGWAHKKKKDFSCSDRLFAMNLGVAFYTPEEHFQGARPAPFSLPAFQPLRLRADPPALPPLPDPGRQEMVIMVGVPGAGKSNFAQRHLSTHTYVNMDLLKSASRCIQEVKKALASGRSVVVDNTNPDKQSRARFVSEAKAAGVVCRCLHLQTTREHAAHNLRFRELTDKSHAPVSEMIVRTYEKKFEPPVLEEGFKEIIPVNFVPHFEDSDLEKLYYQFLVS